MNTNEHEHSHLKKATPTNNKEASNMCIACTSMNATLTEQGCKANVTLASSGIAKLEEHGATGFAYMRDEEFDRVVRCCGCPNAALINPSNPYVQCMLQEWCKAIKHHIMNDLMFAETEEEVVNARKKHGIRRNTQGEKQRGKKPVDKGENNHYNKP